MMPALEEQVPGTHHPICTAPGPEAREPAGTTAKIARRMGSETPSSDSVGRTPVTETCPGARGINAHRDADRQCDDRSHQRQLQRGGKALCDEPVTPFGAPPVGFFHQNHRPERH